MTDNEYKPLDNQTESTAKRKKCIKYGVIAGIVIAVIVIVVVVVVVTKKSSSDDDLIENEVGDNPYKVTDGSMTKYSFSAKLNGTAQVESRGLRADEDNPISTELTVSIAHLQRESDSVHIKITDTVKQQYEVDDTIFSRPSVDTTARLEGLKFGNKSEPFSFSFGQDSNGDPYITTENRDLLVYEKYLEMGFTITSQDIFGLGKQSDTFKLSDTMYTIFNNGSSTDNSAHPFLLVKHRDNTCSVIGFINSNAQSIQIRHSSSGKAVVNYYAAGGILEIVMIFKDTMPECISQYHKFIGLPILPPFWALGFGQGSNVLTQESAAEMIKKYNESDIPVEVLYLGDSLLEFGSNFVVNKTAFPDISAFLATEEMKGRKLVPIVDGSVALNDTTNFNKTRDAEAFIKSVVHEDVESGTLIGKLRNMSVGYLDWDAPGTKAIYEERLDQLQTDTMFSGIWLDLNEAYNECDGECPPEKKENDTTSFVGTPKERAPFAFPSEASFNMNTLSSNATHYDADNTTFRTEYNLHNLFGHQHAQASYSYLNKGDRPFLISRSTYTGSGRFTGQFARTEPTWASLKNSVA